MIIGILLLLVAAGYRVAEAFFLGAAGLPNFAPLTAIALCGGLFLPRLWAWAIPLGALLLSDLLLNAHYGVPLLSGGMAVSYGCYALAILAGRALRAAPLWWKVLGTSLAASLLFYVATNTASFFADAYPKTLSGWEQALTVGLPGYPPTWLFFRNSAASDLLFTALYLGCMAAALARAKRKAADPVRIGLA